MKIVKGNGGPKNLDPSYRRPVPRDRNLDGVERLRLAILANQQASTLAAAREKFLAERKLPNTWWNEYSDRRMKVTGSHISISGDSGWNNFPWGWSTIEGYNPRRIAM